MFFFLLAFLSLLFYFRFTGVLSEIIVCHFVWFRIWDFLQNESCFKNAPLFCIVSFYSNIFHVGNDEESSDVGQTATTTVQ